jgi:hypothetical protein
MAKKTKFPKTTIARAKASIKKNRAKKKAVREDFSQAAARIVKRPPKVTEFLVVVGLTRLKSVKSPNCTATAR